MSLAYYNEIDPDACAVLQRLIDDNVIAPGIIDNRSIEHVEPIDLVGFDQCHFFAGGGLWSVAARLAGWPDDKPLWTASCPCQPFSQAGRRGGTDDPRHLWPHVHRLTRSERPPVLVGEQVAGKDGYGWFDGVSTDLAREGYASRTVDIPACAVDAPHQRNRLYWLAVDDGIGTRLEGQRGDGRRGDERSRQARPVAATDDVVLRDAQGERRREGRPEHAFRGGRNTVAGTDVQLQSDAQKQRGGAGCNEAVHEQHGFVIADSDGLFTDANEPVVQGLASTGEQSFVESDARSLRNGSFWSDAEWFVSPLDGKARRAKPGIPFLVDGLPGRVGLWRIAGNAISPILAAEVLISHLETEHMT